ncbi:hypothetical protein Forpe1208_v003812 [Fusarium oxysporum f. sp. rapae]|uniref:Uncharacterized protein n=1 Tax=Fusarium oxysporum f. sp. rapae TaxID=485398 RepID=A0A8J5PC41_FUSOX|nr:hypothetical protein Forpe1208_v003812 [Fusarium oxysporum f. sp. rapae]
MARPKKKKHAEDEQVDLPVKSEAEGQENALTVEIKMLRAENQLLKDSVTDLRNSIESKNMLDGWERLHSVPEDLT